MEFATIEKPQQAAEPQSTEKPLDQFGELMQAVAGLPQDKIEKVTIYTQGFIAGNACK